MGWTWTGGNRQTPRSEYHLCSGSDYRLLVGVVLLPKAPPLANRGGRPDEGRPLPHLISQGYGRPCRAANHTANHYVRFFIARQPFVTLGFDLVL